MIQGLYCLTLPKTPPNPEEKNYAPGEALLEIRRQPLITIFLLSIPIASVHAFFFVRTSQYLGQLNLTAPWADRIFGVGGAGVMTDRTDLRAGRPRLMPFIVKRVPAEEAAVDRPAGLLCRASWSSPTCREPGCFSRPWRCTGSCSAASSSSAS